MIYGVVSESLGGAMASAEVTTKDGKLTLAATFFEEKDAALAAAKAREGVLSGADDWETCALLRIAESERFQPVVQTSATLS